jgi:hypothetical protein
MVGILEAGAARGRGAEQDGPGLAVVDAEVALVAVDGLAVAVAVEVEDRRAGDVGRLVLRGLGPQHAVGQVLGLLLGGPLAGAAGALGRAHAHEGGHAVGVVDDVLGGAGRGELDLAVAVEVADGQRAALVLRQDLRLVGDDRAPHDGAVERLDADAALAAGGRQDDQLGLVGGVDAVDLRVRADVGDAGVAAGLLHRVLHEPWLVDPLGGDLVPAGDARGGDEVHLAVEVDVGDLLHPGGLAGVPGGQQAAVAVEHLLADEDLRELVVVEVDEQRAEDRAAVAEVQDGVGVTVAAVPHALELGGELARVDAQRVQLDRLEVVVGAEVIADELGVAAHRHVAVEVADRPGRGVGRAVVEVRLVEAAGPQLLLAGPAVEDAQGAEALARRLVEGRQHDRGLQLAGVLVEVEVGDRRGGVDEDRGLGRVVGVRRGLPLALQRRLDALGDVRLGAVGVVDHALGHAVRDAHAVRIAVRVAGAVVVGHARAEVRQALVVLADELLGAAAARGLAGRGAVVAGGRGRRVDGAGGRGRVRRGRRVIDGRGRLRRGGRGGRRRVRGAERGGRIDVADAGAGGRAARAAAVVAAAGCPRQDPEECPRPVPSTHPGILDNRRNTVKGSSLSAQNCADEEQVTAGSASRWRISSASAAYHGLTVRSSRGDARRAVHACPCTRCTSDHVFDGSFPAGTRLALKGRCRHTRSCSRRCPGPTLRRWAAREPTSAS